MPETILNFLHSAPLWLLLIIIVAVLLVLAKGADLLVDEAVLLSLKLGVPQIVIGATIVSLGTTLPEAAVSVMGAIKGNPELALGNAVGSIIADTGLILGLAAVLKPLPLDQSVVHRQGWIQVGAGVLLVVSCFPWSHPAQVFAEGGGGTLPQWMGWIFCILLVIYLVMSLRWSKSQSGAIPDLIPPEIKAEASASLWAVAIKLVLGITLVVLSSQVLIPTVEITAERVGVPDAIIAATLVALGTSLPELITAITAVRKNQGSLAVGNVIGADILNVLFVAGVSASVTSGGLYAGPYFFLFLFPAMLLLLVIFRIGIRVSGTHLSRPFGFLLIGVYLAVTAVSYFSGVDFH